MECVFATTERTCFLAILVRENAEPSGQGGSLELLQLTVKGQRNLRPAQKNNLTFPATGEDPALRVRTHAQGRKELM